MGMGEGPRWRLPARLRVLELVSLAAVSGVLTSAASCLTRAMSVLDGIRLSLAYPPGVAVLASERSRTVRWPALKRVNPPPRGERADSAIGVMIAARGVGSSSCVASGTPFAPNEVISLSDAFLAVSLFDPAAEGGVKGGLVAELVSGESVSFACWAA
jgi:hypothetical protein